MAAPLPLLPESAPFAPEHIEALNAVMARTSAEQRQWLSGFLAGYHAATAGAPLAVPAPAAAPRARIPLTILYGIAEFLILSVYREHYPEEQELTRFLGIVFALLPACEFVLLASLEPGFVVERLREAAAADTLPA